MRRNLIWAEERKKEESKNERKARQPWQILLPHTLSPTLFSPLSHTLIESTIKKRFMVIWYGITRALCCYHVEKEKRAAKRERKKSFQDSHGNYVQRLNFNTSRSFSLASLPSPRHRLAKIIPSSPHNPPHLSIVLQVTAWKRIIWSY